MKKNPILTIGIPTYNRPEKIQRAVRLLLPQLTDDVVLRVRDNCSPIPVETLFTEEELRLFTISRNKINVGGDANIIGVLYDCETDWCWDLGDDDEIAPNAVDTILKTISSNPECVFLKFNTHFSKKIVGFDNMAEISKNRYLYSNLLFMSTSIFNMAKARESLFYYYKYLSTMNGQLVLLFKYLEQNENGAVLLSKDKIILKNDTAEWSHEDFVMPLPLLLHAFKDKRKTLNSNLFSNITFEMFWGIFYKKNMSASTRLKLFNYVAYHYGYWNSIRYHYDQFAQYLFYLIMPESLYSKLKAKRKAKLISKQESES